MNTRFAKLVVVNATLVLLAILAACAPAATPTAEIVKETVLVEEKVEVEKLVTTTPEPAGPVTITFWHGYNPVETEFLDETVIPAFEAANPNIKVETLSVPYDDFRRKLVTSLAGGTPPDRCGWSPCRPAVAAGAR